jgi:general stress protein CsbA
MWQPKSRFVITGIQRSITRLRQEPLLINRVSSPHFYFILSIDVITIMAGGVHRSKKSKASKVTDSRHQTEDVNVGKAATSKEDSLKEQVDRALAAILANQDQTSRIHASWRTQLHLVSMVILFIVLTQVQEPASTCMKEIKDWNEIISLSNEGGEHVIGILRAVRYAVSDSMMEILSIMCGLALVRLLSRPPTKDDFATVHFRVSCFFIPFIISSYYYNRSLGCLYGVDNPLSPKSLDEKDPTEVRIDERPRRTFPIILLFHLIGSLSLFFMQSQRKQLEASVEKIQQLKKDLLQPKKKI